MNKTDEDLSLHFYQHLCNIIGSEDVVKTRRKIFCAIDCIAQHPGFVGISSGSKAEGLDLEGSDYDQMFLYAFMRVYESMLNVSISTNTIPLLMDISDKTPGFAKLQLSKSKIYRRFPIIYQFCDIEEGIVNFSSKLFRELYLQDGMIIHGPCHSTRDLTYDSVQCFRCNEWITPAHNWIYRSRSSWPDNKLVTAVVKHGVLFVPIGCKGSLNENLEWRISFSMAEKQLIHSFSHTQLCYALMKIILKDTVEEKHGGLICSYFLKTIMLWLCEETSPSQWNPRNIITCFRNCLRRLIYCVEHNTCLHYFIPENNLFKDRFTGFQQKSLLNTLHDINSSWWTYVFHTATFRNYRTEQIDPLSSSLTASAISSLSYTDMAFDTLFIWNMKQTITHLTNINDKELSAYLISLQWMQLPNNNNLITDRNKSFYKQYKKSLHYFKAGLFCNIISAWSSLASLFYKHKRFHECIDVLNYCLSKCTPDKNKLHSDNDLSEQTIFRKMKDAIGLLSTCKHLLIESVQFHAPFCLLPVELTPVLKLFDEVFLMFPPVVYLQILLFYAYII
ncbi:Hypothetical predicted protein [Mytilus galloprovincialis]|uniref:Mab-21-like HhH/H2TH-like domain-containing protein n=1 Tax=Mytilus galloprovincialis TaxID=29158 RepID=A0A8B6D0H5_MYTGA|nr:Hypothetical predicted protein [Mytilus galloprovincialis]